MMSSPSTPEERETILHYSSSPSSPPPSFFSLISTVAVAQISQSVGYDAAQPSALRSLSDIAGRYLQSLSAVAVSTANSNGRTDCNAFDVVAAIEHMSAPHGFVGASDPLRPVTQSGALREIVDFVDVVDDIPFAKPIRRCGGGGVTRDGGRIVSFAQARREPPAHVPRWLPVFPVFEKERTLQRKRDLWPFGEKDDVGSLVGSDRRKRKGEGNVLGRGKDLPKERERVRFIFRMGTGSGPKQKKNSNKEGEAKGGGKKAVISIAKGMERDQRLYGSVSQLNHCEVGWCSPLTVCGRQ